MKPFTIFLIILVLWLIAYTKRPGQFHCQSCQYPLASVPNYGKN